MFLDNRNFLLFLLYHFFFSAAKADFSSLCWLPWIFASSAAGRCQQLRYHESLKPFTNTSLCPTERTHFTFPATSAVLSLRLIYGCTVVRHAISGYNTDKASNEMFVKFCTAIGEGFVCLQVSMLLTHKIWSEHKRPIEQNQANRK